MRSRRNLLLILLIVLLIFLVIWRLQGREDDTPEIEETPQGEVTETTEEETTETDTPDSPDTTDTTETPGEETETPRGNATEFSLGGISFLYSDDLAQNVSGGKVGASTSYGYFGEEGGGNLLDEAPDFIDLMLETSDIPGQVSIRTIRDESGTFYPGYEFAQADLTALESDVRSEAGGDDQPQAQFRYVDFANGNGRRSLQFSPSLDPEAELTNDRLFYIFEGVSADGRQYVWFRYPVQASILNEGAIADADEVAVLAQIDALAGDNFTPDLALLDAVAATLNAAPTDTFIASGDAEEMDEEETADTPDTTEEEETADTPEEPDTPSTGATSTYVVQSGDNLFLIGLAYGLPWTDIADVNDLEDPNDLEIGQTITIPASAPIVVVQAPTTYLVQSGDTLSQIAEFYGLNWENLAAYNGIGWPYSIQAGQTLYIPRR